MASCARFVISALCAVTLVHLSEGRAKGTYLDLPQECQLPRPGGECRRPFFETYKHFYNTETGRCELFRYAGCDGNANMFDSYDACRKKCMAGQVTITPTFIYDHSDVCQRPVDENEGCLKSSQIFYYNTAQRACLSYQGCNGNGNNFTTLEACEERCSNNDKDYGNYDNSDICMLPSDSGMCLAYSELIYYNRHTGQCDWFVSGGCWGNANSFNDVASCEARCGGAGVIGGSYPEYY